MQSSWSWARALVLAASFVVLAQHNCRAYEKPTDGTDLVFERGESALNASQREKIVKLLLHIKTQDWCPLEVIVVQAFADQSEGDQRTRLRLIEARNAYVKDVLYRHGVPSQIVFSDATLEPPLRPGVEWGGRASLEAVGSRGWPRCSFEVGPSGFRTKQ